MKKQYIKPIAEAMAFDIESPILGASLPDKTLPSSGSSTIDSEGEYLSKRRHGWDSSNWSSSSEE